MHVFFFCFIAEEAPPVVEDAPTACCKKHDEGHRSIEFKHVNKHDVAYNTVSKFD